MSKKQHKKQQRNKVKQMRAKKANLETKRASNKSRIIIKPKNSQAKKVERSWQKEQQKPITQHEAKKIYQQQRKQNDNLMKIIVLNELQADKPDVQKMSQSLKKIKSRGLRQRLTKKVRPFIQQNN